MKSLDKIFLSLIFKQTLWHVWGIAGNKTKMWMVKSQMLQFYNKNKTKHNHLKTDFIHSHKWNKKAILCTNFSSSSKLQKWY